MHYLEIENDCMESFAISVASSIAATLILAIFGKWKGWWWKEKSQASINLAANVLKALGGDLDGKTRDMVYATKFLRDSLIGHYKHGSPYDSAKESETLQLIDKMLFIVRPLTTELSAANPELDHLKRAVTASKGPRVARANN
jgi:hypothetical protein